MHKYYLFIVAIWLVPLAALSAQTRRATIEILNTPGLVALWDFAEPTGQPKVSRGGIHQHILLHGGGSLNQIQEGPLSGYSTNFDGRTDYFTIPSSKAGSLDISGENAEVTVIAWIKRKNSGTGFIAGLWQEDNNDPRRQYGLFVNLPLFGGLHNVAGHVSLTGRNSDGIPYSRDYSANASPVPLDKWTMIAFTYKNPEIRSYINGKFEHRPTFNDTWLGQDKTYAKNPYFFPLGIGSNKADFTVGAVRLTSGMGNFFSGQIGGIAVFNRALSGAELLVLHTAALEPGAAHLSFSFDNLEARGRDVEEYGWKKLALDTGALLNWTVEPGPGQKGTPGYLRGLSSGGGGLIWTDLSPAIESTQLKALRYTIVAPQETRVQVAFKISGTWYIRRTLSARTTELLSDQWLQSANNLVTIIDTNSTDWQVLGMAKPDDRSVALPRGTIDAMGFLVTESQGYTLIDEVELALDLSRELKALPSESLANLSVRGTLGEGEETLICGFIVSGTANRQIYIRVVGPSIRVHPFHVSAAAEDPSFSLYDANGNIIAGNDDWDSNRHSALEARLGAFPLTPGSRDAALLVALPPGPYTVHARNTAPGNVVLVEVYRVE